MNSLLSSLLTVLVTIIFIVLLRPLAYATGLVDKPDERKHHEGSIPLVGGISIYLAVATATLVGTTMVGKDVLIQSGAGVFLLSSLLLVVVGVWDDLRNLSPLLKLVAQIAAALIMIYLGGIVVTDLGSIGFSGNPVRLGIWAVPFTVFATVGVINAINMADGLDGLVGNMTLVSLLGLGLATSMWGGVPVAAMLNILSAGVIGFLLFNQRLFWRPKAAVFLGDAGSMMLGFALAWAAIVASQGPDRSLSPAAALWFVAVPVCDTLSVAVRRLLEGKSPLTADARHLHHLFMRVGFSVNETLLFMCGLAVAGVTVGLAAEWYGVPEWALLLLFLAAWLACALVSYKAWRQERFLGRPFREQISG
ncbi:MAG: MraY family glycosyltransferase [Gammaproteobacteria bacterium]|jgi:UDP-GlcNAc:undecaprenyl-phosphate GlcNAc-1-phosphate transferase